MTGRKLHFTFTASTGSLADNHDLLEFVVSEPEMLEGIIEAQESEKNAPLVDIDVESGITTDKLASELLFLASEGISNQIKD